MADKTGDVKAFFQRFDQPPVLYLNVRHIADNAAFRIDQPRQNDRNGDELADFALTIFNKGGDDIQQRVLKRFLGTLRQREVLFFQRLTA